MNLENKQILHFIGELGFGEYEDEKCQTTLEPTNHHSFLHPHLFLILFVSYKLCLFYFSEGLLCVCYSSQITVLYLCAFLNVYCATLIRRRGSDKNLPTQTEIQGLPLSISVWESRWQRCAYPTSHKMEGCSSCVESSSLGKGKQSPEWVQGMA